jgi:hypothetical protein
MLAKCCEVLARRRAFPADMAVVDEYLSEDVLEELPPTTAGEATEGVYRELEPGRSEPEVKPLNLDADREEPSVGRTTRQPDPTKQSPARKAAQRAKAPPAPPVAQDEAPGDIQAQYDAALAEAAKEKQAEEELAFARQRAAEFAGDDVVARPEPPEGKLQPVSGAPETKAQEMSKFWAAAKRFEKDTGKIIAASKEHFGGAPAELEGLRRALLLKLLETGELPEQVAGHEVEMACTEDGNPICSICEKPCDEDGKGHI